jgi:hypothetical protein
MRISGCDDNIPVLTLRNVDLQVETRIIGIIQAKKPVVCMPA